MDVLIWLGGIALICMVAAGVLVAMARRQLAEDASPGKAGTTPTPSKARRSAPRSRNLESDLAE